MSSVRRLARRLSFLIVAACNAHDDTSTFEPARLRDPNAPLWAISDSADLLVANAVAKDDTVPLFSITAAMFASQADDPDIIVGLGTGERALIYLTASGEFLTATGRRGGGPGEIATVSRLVQAGNNIAVWDIRNRKIDVFSSAGVLVRELSTEAARSTGANIFVGLLNDTLPVMAPSHTALGQHWFYQVRDFDDVLVSELVGPRESAPEARIRLEFVEDGGRRARGTAITSLHGCLPQTRHVTLGDRIFLADDINGVIRSIDRFGTIRTVFGSDHRAVISPEMIEGVRKYIASIVRLQNGPLPGPGGASVTLTPRRLPESSMDAVLERVGHPGDPLPSMWSHMIADPSGRLWLRRSTCYAPGSHGIWQVVDTAGALLANAAIPDSIDVHDIDHDRILGVVRDSLDIEYIAVFEIER